MGGGGDRSYDGEKVWSSVKHLVLSGLKRSEEGSMIRADICLLRLVEVKPWIWQQSLYNENILHPSSLSVTPCKISKWH